MHFCETLRDVDHCMLWQAAKRSHATLTDIQVHRTDDNKAIHNAILSECNHMTFKNLGLEQKK